MEAALTAAAAATAATFAAAATAWRSPIHPPAAGETQSLGGAWGRGRPPPPSSRLPELPLAPPTLCPPLRLRPPPRPPAASQPRGRLLSPGSAVSMTPGKHSGASAAAANARGWGAGTPGAGGERGGRPLPNPSPPCPPLRGTTTGSRAADRKFRRGNLSPAFWFAEGRDLSLQLGSISSIQAAVSLLPRPVHAPCCRARSLRKDRIC